MIKPGTRIDDWPIHITNPGGRTGSCPAFVHTLLHAAPATYHAVAKRHTPTFARWGHVQAEGDRVS
jgi:hypothetical protein